MSERDDFDAVVVGASIAGSSIATLLGRAGLKVALVESRPDPDAYKKLCTHFIQPSATPTIQRLGLAEKIEAAGGMRNGVNTWTRWGWIVPPGGEFDGKPLYGYSLRRRVLDPLVRSHAAETVGVELMLGHTARDLIKVNGRYCGVRVDANGESKDLRARLVVAADGRHSRIAEMAGSKPKLGKNDRFGYFTQYKGIDLSCESKTRSQIWFLDPGVAYAFRNDDGIVLLTYMGPKSELEEFKQDIEANLLKLFGELPDGPDLSRAERVSEVIGALDTPNRRRKPYLPGLAFVGDAALASDPLFGIGCGWAFQSAEWLADAVTAPLRAGDPASIDRALKKYAKTHRKELGLHDFLIRDYSTGRKFNLFERTIFAAATRDQEIAHTMEALAGRVIIPKLRDLPKDFLRATMVNRRARRAASA